MIEPAALEQGVPNVKDSEMGLIGEASCRYERGILINAYTEELGWLNGESM